MIKPETFGGPRPVIRTVVSLALLVALSLLIWASARTALASYRTARAISDNRETEAEAAVSLSSADPETHFVRGAFYEVANKLPAAIGEYQTAAALRPGDYVYWLTLARALELNGDRAGAIAAARRALPLAPYYAQTHWQLGNLLVRAGQRDEGLKELRVAGTSNPDLLPGIVELAGQLFGGNAQQIKEAIRPDSAVSFLALANYFKKRNDVAEAMEMLRAAGSASEQARRQYVGELITAKDFGNAYALWSPAHPGNKPGVLVDPGFEQEQALDEAGFGWRTDSKAPAVSLSLDPANPKDGRSSLRVDFNGDSDPGAAIISQLVLIEPGRHYKFHFAYRTDALVTGGPPQLLILDAKDNRVLGQSAGWPENSDGWRDQTIELVAGESTNALLIAVQRDRCPKSPCPIFGRLWLDSFALEKE